MEWKANRSVLIGTCLHAEWDRNSGSRGRHAPAFAFVASAPQEEEADSFTPMKLEHHKQPLAPVRVYRLRQLKYLTAALLFVGLSLGIGVWGYMRFGHLTAVDAFLNASMILGGMGPVDPLPDESAKLFASFYALFSGIALLTTVAVILAPMVHRVLHRLHLDDGER